MAWRNVMVQSPARLRIRHNQLIIQTDVEHSRPIEDIDCLLIESAATVVSADVLSRLSINDVAVLFCDEKHMPCSVLLPVSGHSRTLHILRLQLSASKPLKKQLWRSIVQQKIKNQALCLMYNGLDSAQVHALSNCVQSGDSTNMEAKAAAAYFKELFGKRFTRSAECARNAALNYGYAILRGCVARSLKIYGFEPCLGLFHHNELNAFNLADDFIEPFRPVVDLYVSQHVPDEGEMLCAATKRGLFSLLSNEICSGGERHSIGYAIERMVQSYHTSLASASPQLLLPELMPLSRHEYE